MLICPGMVGVVGMARWCAGGMGSAWPLGWAGGGCCSRGGVVGADIEGDRLVALIVAAPSTNQSQAKSSRVKTSSTARWHSRRIR